MDGIKSILASRTVWMNIIGFAATMPILAKYLAGVDPGALVDAGASIVSVKATKQLVAP